MAKHSVFGTSVMGPDESAVGTIGNIAEMFNPENQAKGQMAQAHAEYYRQHGEQAAAAKMHLLAQAKEIQNRLDANNVEAQVAAGIPRQQAIINVGYGKSATDVATSYNKGRGGEMFASGQGDPYTAAALTGLNPNINSAYTVGQGNDIRNQNDISKLSQIVTQGMLHNQGLANKGVVVPQGGMYIPPGSIAGGQPAPTAPVIAGVSPADLVLGGNPMPSSAFGGSSQQLAQPGTINSFIPGNGANPSSALGIPAGAILNPKPAKVDKGMSPSQVNAVDTRMRNGMAVLSDIVAGGDHGKDNPLNPGDANAIVTAATTKYPTLPIHQAIPQLIKDQSIQFPEKPGEFLHPTTWLGHNAIVPTAGGRPVQQGLSDIITGGQSASAVNAPASKIGMLDENARAISRQRLQANPALRSDFDTMFGAGATDELLAK